mmetsp:Transcript_13916/g.26206  ORF Transcript_13916/g.26206 Transcript_13916/m.26206 type:complete len:361 (-) Transcript_13916:260-1342(-)|eukprot:CAMPEP_0176484990 /NCGR_PEP_ID=MMETSP0200_2-20121128/4805_1 /TAXON_ID=947934 /ORGANISM="Chaetoceros sp., Strain GSL56" /LENGTH=360 /DNA_ID=CAMNT_0017881613 /DNA_START=224 /DNA_END=1306 /DNA_ORIENTATION=+
MTPMIPSAQTPGIPPPGSTATTFVKQKPGIQTSRGTNGVGQKYHIIKAASEGGDKRMLDVIFERLRHTIRSEWMTGQEVASILETFEEVELTPPTRLTDEEKEDDLLMEMWKEDVKQHVSERRAMDKAKQKLYSTVWTMMSKVLQNKVMGQNGFIESGQKKDVVWLLQTERALVTEFDSTTPEFLSVADAFEKIITYRQLESMDNADYVKNLMTLIKVYEQYCGPYGVHYMEIKKINDEVRAAVDDMGNPFSDDVKAAAKNVMIRDFREAVIAMLIIRNACKRRYSSLKKNLVTDFGLKINKYPDTIDSAVNALNVAESQLPPFLKKQRSPEVQFVQTNGEQKEQMGRSSTTLLAIGAKM